ncbi:LuxR C-terminal-related transcriptional regulator [Microbacterium paludicola]|uniref:LuxR C-terminal-related transcriptional regulator n=1 Tax=Microbacterium paludicola TaxID=300019 RepID=UPI0031E0A1EA
MRQGEDPRVSAIFRALADGDHLRAIELSEAHWSYLSSFRLEVKRTVADSLPDDVLRARPLWAVTRQVLAHTFFGRLRPSLWGGVLPPLRRSDSLIDRLAVQTAYAAAARFRGRLEDAARWVARAQAELAAAPESERAGARLILADLHHEWALVALFAGRGSDAITMFTRSFEAAEQEGHPRAAINAAAELAWLVTLTGKRAQALAWLGRIARLRAEHPTVHHTTHTDRIARAQLLLDELDLAGARAELAAVGDARDHALLLCAVRALIDAHDPELDPATTLAHLRAETDTFHDGWAAAHLNEAMLEVAQTRLYLRSGQAALAVQAIGATERVSGEIGSGRAAAALHQLGDDERAYAMTTRFLAEGSRWPRMRVHALAVHSILLLRRGEERAAAETFSEALELVAEHRLLISLAILPADDLRELAALLPQRHPRRYLALAVADAPIASTPGPEGPRLSARESTVLAVLAEGITVAEAAARLMVSVNTVKTQLRMLYLKLGVHDRRDLLVAARRRGLV